MFRIISLLIGYIFGCFQSSYIFAKLIYKIDIREYGSNNAGATNTTRVLGKKVGLLVFIFDILKAVIAYIICSYIFDGDGTFLHKGGDVLPGFYAGIGVILGHNFPFYLKFSGGKGSASGLGVILSLDFRIAILSYIAGIIVVAITRYISLASLVITLFFTIGLIITSYKIEVILLAVFMLFLSMYKHRENIKRLINGTENKFSFKSKGSLEK